MTLLMRGISVLDVYTDNFESFRNICLLDKSHEHWISFIFDFSFELDHTSILFHLVIVAFSDTRCIIFHLHANFFKGIWTKQTMILRIVIEFHFLGLRRFCFWNNISIGQIVLLFIPIFHRDTWWLSFKSKI